MAAGTHPIRGRYDYAKLERNALELAEGCEAGSREALLQMAARFRDEASSHPGLSIKKRLAASGSRASRTAPPSGAGIDARRRRARDVADVVGTRAARAQADVLDALDRKFSWRPAFVLNLSARAKRVVVGLLFPVCTSQGLPAAARQPKGLHFQLRFLRSTRAE